MELKKTLLSLCLIVFGMAGVSAQTESKQEFYKKANEINLRIQEAFDKKDYRKGELACKESIKLYKDNGEKPNPGDLYNLACCYSLQKKKKDAIKSFKEAYDAGWYDGFHAEEDKDLDNIRDNAEVKKIIEKMKYHYLDILKDAADYTATERHDTLPKFFYANPNDSNLVKVRQYFNLDSVAGAGDEISKIKNIMTFIHNKIRHDGSSGMPSPRNAIAMTKACKDGSRGINCRGLATVLNECYLAMGFKSMFVTCMPKDDIYDCHVINAVYSCTLDKWIWMDPTNNAWVTDEKGNLLGISEVRERLRNGQPLVLNDEANWNNKNKVTINSYLYSYMAKNLYYLTFSTFYGFETESNRYPDRRYVVLMPTGFFSEAEKGRIVVNDDKWIWQSPYGNK